MPSTRVYHRGSAVATIILILGPMAASAEQAPPTVSIARPPSGDRHPLRPRDAAGRRSFDRSSATGGWWLGTAGIALALAACGGISLASRRYLPQNGAGALRVIGRTSLSPKHTVYLLEVGGRVLIVGAGAQGAPSLLGELNDPAEVARLVPQPPMTSPLAGRLDRLMGDES